MNNQTVRTAVALCMAALVGLAASTAMAMDADEEGWITFDGSDGQIALEGAVNGEPARIVIDSTANASVISTAFAERAGIRKDQLLEFEMGGSLTNQRVFGSRRFELELNDSSLSFNGLPIVPSDEFDMILGHQIFEDAVVQIDYPNERFRLLPVEGVNFEGNTEVRKGPLGELLVEMTIQGTRAWLTLDTGLAGPTLLNESFVVSNGLDDRRIETAQEADPENPESEPPQLLQLDDVELGPYRFEQFIARYSSDIARVMDAGRRETGTRIRQQRSRHDGLLGYEVLRNFLVTADFSNGKLHLHLP